MRGSAEEAEGRWRKDLEGARATSQLQGCRLELERGRQKEELLQAWRAGEDGDDDCEVQVTSSSNDQHQCQQQQQQQQQQQRQQPQQRQQERDDEGGDTGDAAVLREQLQLTRGALRQLADSAQVVRQQLLTQLASTRVDVHQLQACVQTQGAFVSALLRGLRARQRAEREEAKQRAQELERSRAEAAAQVQAMKEVLQVQIRSWNLPTRSFAPAELATILSALAVAGVVDHAFLDRLLGLARPQLRLGGFSARELSATAHAVASLGHRPERAFMSDLLSQAFERLSAFEPRDLAHLLWALGRLGVVPDAFGSGPAGGITGEEKDKSRGLVRELLRRCCEAPAALAALAPHELADVAWALCASGVLPSAPPASAGAVAGAASSGRGGEGRRGPGEGASVGAAGVSPSSSGSGHQGPGDSAGAAEAEAAAFLQALLSAARAQLPAFEPRDLAALAHALSKLVGAGGAGEAGQQGGATQAGGPATAAAAAAGDDGAGVRPFVGELMQQARSRSRRLGPEARRQLAHAARAFGLDEVVVQLTGS